MNLESSSATWSFSPEEYNVHLCSQPEISLGGPAKLAANGPVCTGSAQIGLLYGTFFIPPTDFCPVKWQTWQCRYFFIFNELTNILNCLTVSTREIQSAIFIHHTTKTNTKEHSGLHGITVEYEDKRDMMQCCFYNWFCSTVHSIMVYRNPITANCFSKHEHLAGNDSTSFTLCQFFLMSL